MSSGVRCARCGRLITNDKNIRLWERNGGYGHGCWEKIQAERARERALHNTLERFFLPTPEQKIEAILNELKERELPIKGGVFSEV